MDCRQRHEGPSAAQPLQGILGRSHTRIIKTMAFRSCSWMARKIFSTGFGSAGFYVVEMAVAGIISPRSPNPNDFASPLKSPSPPFVCERIPAGYIEIED